MSKKNPKKPKPQKKPLTAAQRQQKKVRNKAKLERQKIYQWIFINGKQVRIRRPVLIDGMDPEEYIRNNADDIWLAQNERFDILDERYNSDEDEAEAEADRSSEDEDICFDSFNSAGLK